MKYLFILLLIPTMVLGQSRGHLKHIELGVIDERPLYCFLVVGDTLNLGPTVEFLNTVHFIKIGDNVYKIKSPELEKVEKRTWIKDKDWLLIDTIWLDADDGRLFWDSVRNVWRNPNVYKLPVNSKP